MFNDGTKVKVKKHKGDKTSLYTALPIRHHKKTYGSNKVFTEIVDEKLYKGEEIIMENVLEILKTIGMWAISGCRYLPIILAYIGIEIYIWVVYMEHQLMKYLCGHCGWCGGTNYEKTND